MSFLTISITNEQTKASRTLSAVSVGEVKAVLRRYADRARSPFMCDLTIQQANGKVRRIWSGRPAEFSRLDLELGDLLRCEYGSVRHFLSQEQNPKRRERLQLELANILARYLSAGGSMTELPTEVKYHTFG